MNKKLILINCSNLHHGGGVAVASSFIASLTDDVFNNFDVGLLISSKVKTNIYQSQVDLNKFKFIAIHDSFGLRGILFNTLIYRYRYDVLFTVFGPFYSIFKLKNHLVGFAQPNIAYPNVYSSHCKNIIEKYSASLKYFMQGFFFSRANALVVEHEHVKRAIKNNFHLKNMDVYVVSGTFDTVFKSANAVSRNIDYSTNMRLNIGVISKNYAHKNLKIVPNLLSMLKSRYNIIAIFHVTFTDNEWNSIDQNDKKYFKNHGSLLLNECPSFYDSLDAIVFPTLLECFSAVPLEVMARRRPLFTSNLDFMKQICGNHALYFDPHDVSSIAKSIYDYFLLPAEIKEGFINSANKFAQTFPTAQDRATSYINILQRFIL